MDKFQEIVADFAKKLVAEVKAAGVPHVEATTAFGVAAKILAAEADMNVPFDDCAGWAKKHLTDGFAWEVAITADSPHPVVTPIAPKFNFIAE